MDSIQLMVDWWFGGLGFKSGYPLSMFNAGIPGVQITRPQTTNLGRYQKLEERQQMLKNITPLRPQGLAFFSPESWLDITGGIFQGTRGLGPETLTETWQPKVFKTELPFFWGEIKKVHMVKIQISNDQNLPPSQKKHKLFSARGASVGKNGHGSKADLCIWQGAS